MLKIIDRYILKRYLATFFVMLIMFIPIGIIVDVAEKVNKMLAKNVPIDKIMLYYLDFTIYFANMLFPILLFLSVIWFTSKLANNTEIVAILSSGISFGRFLRPYIIGASIVCVFAIIMGFFLVPNASKGYNDFRYTYLKNGSDIRQSQDVYRQISQNEFIYVSNFVYSSKTGYDFSYTKFKDNKIDHKISASRIKFNESDTTYTLYSYKKRTIGELDDVLESENKKIMKFDFDVDDLTPVIYAAETMTLKELDDFIEKEKVRGSSNINTYEVVKYRRYSIPISAFILTIIAVSVSSIKRRGGMGVNLAIGIMLAFTYIFFDKIFGTLAEKSSISPMLAVWLPNITYGILAFFLLRNAKR